MSKGFAFANAVALAIDNMIGGESVLVNGLKVICLEQRRMFNVEFSDADGDGYAMLSMAQTLATLRALTPMPEAARVNRHGLPVLPSYALDRISLTNCGSVIDYDTEEDDWSESERLGIRGYGY